VAKRSNEHVGVEAKDDSDDVDRVLGHQPKGGHGGGRPSGVEEVSGGCVAGVEPSAHRGRLSMVVLVNPAVEKGERVHNPVAGVVDEITEGKDDDEGDESVHESHLIHVIHHCFRSPDRLDDKPGDERKHHKAVEIGVEEILENKLGALVEWWSRLVRKVCRRGRGVRRRVEGRKRSERGKGR